MRRARSRYVKMYRIAEIRANSAAELAPNLHERIVIGTGAVDVYRPSESRIRVREMPGLSGGFVDDPGVTRLVPSK